MYVCIETWSYCIVLGRIHYVDQATLELTRDLLVSAYGMLGLKVYVIPHEVFYVRGR